MNLPYFYALFFVLIVVFSLVLNKLLLKFVKSLGIRNHQEHIIRWSAQSKPSIGGIGFFIAFLLAIPAYFIYSNYMGLEAIKLAEIGFLMAVTLAFLMGLSDDAYNTTPLLKFAIQVSCAVLLIITNTYISIFPLDILNYAFTIFWVVAVMNSINMLDNMDGITTSVSIVILAMAAATSIFFNKSFDLFQIVVVATVASLLGFLRYNWNPSKMFMGDTGSQFLGIILAAVGIKYFWNVENLNGFESVTKQLIVTILIFIVPISDTLTVIVNRMAKGQSPFVGGKDHTTHYLSYSGFSERQVALIMIGLSVLGGTIALLFVFLIDDWNHLYTLPGVIVGLGIFAFLYLRTASSLRKKVKSKAVSESKSNVKVSDKVLEKAS